MAVRMNNSLIQPREVSAEIPACRPVYSICTLVTDQALYQQMLHSCQQAGFDTPDCEFLWLDNGKSNQWDAYSGIQHFLFEARGDYIILCHQDILLNHDRREQLERCISELDRIDSHWALLGNAGGVRLGKIVHRISDPHGGNLNSGGFPRRVQALDENFILLKRASNPGISSDLQGFHMYGLDLCLQAELRGFHAYVVDFHLTHLGKGNRDTSFHQQRQALIEKYQKAFAPAWLQTTCTSLFISGSRRLNNWLNRPTQIKWAKSIFKRSHKGH